MGDLILKKEVKVSYDKEKFTYSFEPVNVQKMRKVTSRAFPCLLGINKDESSGKATLERFGLTEKEQIDPYYLVRDNLAEKLAYDYLKAHYKESKGVDLVLATWKKEEINYDNFSKNEKFGGMIDIAIAQPAEYRAVAEVKSKSMKDYENIKGSRGNPEEVYQGLFLSYLSKTDKCLMAYVFFTPEQEQEIKDRMADRGNVQISFKDVKIEMFKYLVSELNMPQLTQVSYQTLELFKANCTIASTYFTKSENDYLQGLAGNDVTDSDLPF